MNYFVVTQGHIAWFEQFEPALEFCKDFNGLIFSYYGMTWGREKYGARTF